MSRLSIVATLLVVLAVLAACATTSEGGSGARASDYVVAEAGASWTYQVVPGPPQPQTVRITHQDEQGFFVDDAGGRLAPRSDGVFDGTRFLIKEPLVAGAVWSAVSPGPRPGMPGVAEHYTLQAVGTQATVPAGTFDDCLVVQAETKTRDPNDGRAATLIMTWTWAKGVGLVKLTQAVRYDGDDAVHQTASMELTTTSRSAR